MTIRIALLPYGPSESCVALRDAIRAEIASGNLDGRITLLRAEGSAYQARETDVLINYGNRRMPQSFFGRANVLNNLQALNLAANKLNALQTMADAGVQTIEFTTDRNAAQTWVDSNQTVYARGVLNGHSGEGITVHTADNAPDVPSAPLYTKGITSQRREWRVHIFKGVITYVQKKIRRNGYREDANYREDIRNVHTGWVYSNQFNDVPTDAVLRSAYDAVAALGLDFGAVDIISRQDRAWVLEVNTAPGLTGTTLETYQHNFCEFAKSLFSTTPPTYRVAYEIPAPLITVVEDIPESAEPVRLEEEPVTQAHIAMPPTQAEEATDATRGAVMNPQVQNNTEIFDTPGMYLVDLRSVGNSNQVNARNVIVYASNGYVFRHGWNLPIARDRLVNARKIDSVRTGNTDVAVA